MYLLTVILSERAPNVEYSTRHYNILLGARSLEMTIEHRIHQYLIFNCSIFVLELVEIYRNDNFIYYIKYDMLLLILAN